MGHLSKPKEFSDCAVNGSKENALDSERETVRKSCRGNFFWQENCIDASCRWNLFSRGRLRANLV